MNEYNTDRKYDSFKIPNRQDALKGGAHKALPPAKKDTQITLFDDVFYEIDYDSSPMKGVGKFVLKSQKIETPKKDEIRELFYKMRDIARQYHMPLINYSKFYDTRVQKNNAWIFYKQAMFMKDFEDDYAEQIPFSSYFPYYQMLGYEQLRTYFTWRTNVRKGLVSNTSLSYVFLYIYELLNNVGVDSPKDALSKLMFFWTSFRKHDSSVDKYMIRWLKDYHIYYNLPTTFQDFIEEHKLTRHYPKVMDKVDSFQLYCSISKYDISKSTFYTEETSKLISDCLGFVIHKLRIEFETAGMSFDDTLFSPTKKLVPWKPFKDALFYPWLKQADRRIIISDHEIYLCTNNEWTFSSVLTSDKGRQLVGYVMKQMEAVLRKASNYKFKITANLDMVHQETLRKFKQSGLLIDNIVQDAVIEFYREATKTVVTVDPVSLARIRQEALATQESLTVEEEAKPIAMAMLPTPPSEPEQCILSAPFITDSAPVSDGWKCLRDSLSHIEIQALNIILLDDNSKYVSIKEFADNHNIMLEVLVDQINEKAVDTMGDNILDHELTIYEDYEEQVKGMVKNYEY